MKNRALAIAVFLIGAVAGLAQEGYPLNGSWHGSWGDKKNIVLFMHWNSKSVDGTLNPGPNSVPLKVVTLDPVKWMVHIEAQLKDGSKVVADGKLDNIGSYNRTITGTWNQGSAKGDFKVTRD